MADSIRQLSSSEILDDAIEEEWLRETDEPDLRDVDVMKLSEYWQVAVAMAEFVREEPLESEMRRRLDEALRAVAGVDVVFEEDREIWGVYNTTGAALASAAAAVLDDLAPRVRAHIEGM